MKKGLFNIEYNREIAPNVFEIGFSGDASAFTRPGQFAEIALDGFFLRRPFSVCDVSENGFSVIYKVVGEGTAYLSGLKAGTLDALTGLGNGFDSSQSGNAPLLVGGGAGIPPLYWLAKKLIGEGKTPSVVLGFNKAEEIFLEEEFQRLGASVTVATADGSKGFEGFATSAAMGIERSYYYACGPIPMLKSLVAALGTDGEVSLEERMGCGFGACMGCSVMTKSGAGRVCKEGPVFTAGELLW